MIIEASEEEQNSAKFRGQNDRPKCLHVHATNIVAANYRSHETGSKADLAKCLNSFQVIIFFIRPVKNKF